MTNKFDVVDLSSIEARNIFQKITNKGGITLFVGSAISMWHPTLLPSGQTVTNSLANMLVEQFNISNGMEKR